MAGTEKGKRRSFTQWQRGMIYRCWRDGHTYAELAKSYATHRQTTRGIVLSFKPRLEDYRLHDYHRRNRLYQQAERRHRKERPPD